MRDASGDLVEVRVQEPWALHELNFGQPPTTPPPMVVMS